MARNEQFIRQHKVLEILERFRFGRTVEEVRHELVDELGLTSLHTRTVRRDLEALQGAGIDIRIEETARGRIWRLGPKARKAHKVTATSTELIALSLSRDLLYPLAGTPFWQGIQSFWNKLQDELPSAIWQHYEKYRRVLHVLGTPAKSYAQHEGMLKTINHAILDHRVLEIDYQPSGRPVATRRIEPYAVVFFQSSLYILAAACEVPLGEDRMRRLKLDRFGRVSPLDEYFEPPNDFDVESYLGQSFGIFSGGKLRNFRILISAYAAAWVIEDPWHPDQKIERNDDGSIILTVRAAHDLEVLPRVLALGSQAEVLAPASSRRAIAETIGRMVDKYASH